MKEISDRRSIRKYKEDAVNKADIEIILKAGILAPSAKNRQPWKYYVYAGSEKNKLLECMESGLVRERDGNKLLPNSQNGLPDAFNTLRIMKEAPILITQTSHPKSGHKACINAGWDTNQLIS